MALLSLGSGFGFCRNGIAASICRTPPGEGGGSKVQGEGSPHPWRAGAAGTERAKRSGGLHKRSAEDWGSPLWRAIGAEPLSVLSTSVTKQTGDMVYSGARRRQFLSLGNARRCCMPWKESRILDQRLQFLSSYQKEEMSVADLCRQYGISRPTGYRWINRYEETGPEGLVDRSRRPHTCSHATLEPTENAILVLRARGILPGARASSRQGWRCYSQTWCGLPLVPSATS